MSEDTINRVRKCIAEVLAMDPGEITAQSNLVDDLGADSLDLVELMYLLEQEFDIRLSQDDLSLSAQLGLPEEDIHQNEVLTAKALELLRKRFPNAIDILKDGISRRHLAALLTVEETARLVKKKLQS
jgi:acyl carrier protein